MGRNSKIQPLIRELIIVVIKLIAPNKEEIPAKCKEKITISTDLPAWNSIRDKGGYTVHPVPAPLSIKDLNSISIIEGSKNQNLRLFIRGKDISGAPIIRGINQFPKAPTIIGITKKKIIINAWLVTTMLYNWPSLRKTPGWPNSTRISILSARPTIPAHAPLNI